MVYFIKLIRQVYCYNLYILFKGISPEALQYLSLKLGQHINSTADTSLRLMKVLSCLKTNL